MFKQDCEHVESDGHKSTVYSLRSRECVVRASDKGGRNYADR